MIYLDLIINLALLVSISIVSGFIEKRWPRSTRIGVLLQGALFGGASVIGMLRPLDMGAGLIFDGRSVMISLCALFFGPWAAAVSVLMTIPLRIVLGGAGMIMGVSVILSSAGIGLLAHFRLFQATEEPPSTRTLYLFGLAVHLVMVALMITLPGNIIMSTMKRIGIPVILLYPLATILTGKILSDQVSAIRNVDILRKSEAKFKNLFEAANVGKSITLPTGEINVNQSLCDMLGYTQEELRNKKWQEITHAEDIEATQKQIDPLLQGRKDSARFNKRYIHKNGSYIWADVSVAMHRDINRQPLFFITTAIDITERKRLEIQARERTAELERTFNELRESEQEFRTLAEAMPQIVWITRPDGWNIYFNQRWVDYTGMTLEESYGDGWNKPFHPDDQKRAWDAWQNATKNGAEYSLECRLRRADGVYKWWLIRGVPVLDSGGNILKWFGTCTDIDHIKQMEAAIKESGRLNLELVDKLNEAQHIALVGSWEWNLQTDEVWWSDETYQIFGVTKQEFIPSFEENARFIHPDDVEEYSKSFEHCLQTGKQLTLDLRLITPEGQLKYCHVVGHVLFNDSGQKNSFIGTIMDITERKLVEIALQESERKYRNLYHYAKVGLFETSLEEAKIIACNKYYCDLAGFPDIESAIGMDILQLYVNPDDREEVKKVLRTQGYIANHLLQLKNRLTDKIFWIEFSAHVNQSRNIIEGSLIDVTERKLMDEKLYMSEERFRLLSEASFEGIVVHDEGVILQANDQYFKMFGYEPDEALGKEMISVTIDSEALEFVKKQIATGSLGSYESIGIKKDGTRFPIEIRTQKMEYQGRIVRVGAIRDITERKLVEEKIQQLNTELEHKVSERTRELQDSQLALLNLVDDLNQSVKSTALASRKLEETNNELKAFSYSVSHDLRAPLRSIDGFSLALMEDYQEKLDDTAKNYLNKIRAATQHMGLLIEDMLKLSRISHAEFHHESIDLSNLVQSIAQTIQQNNPDKDMKIIIQKDIIIKGDLNSMEIALTNLLENAWKFTGKQKQPLIEFGMTHTEGEKIFFIRDNGVGFDMAYSNKLFGAFQRLHSTDEFPGTGIGLATVKRIITRHGGRIWAEGEVGKGATFFFTLPE